MPQGLGALGVKEIDEILALACRPGMDVSSPRPANEKSFAQLINGSISTQMSFWKFMKE
jgi:hypothetical protein